MNKTANHVSFQGHLNSRRNKNRTFRLCLYTRTSQNGVSQYFYSPPDSTLVQFFSTPNHKTMCVL